MREAFAVQKQKLLKFFFTKNTGLFEILMFEILTKCQLMTELVLNSGTLMFTDSAGPQWVKLWLTDLVVAGSGPA